MTTPSTDTDTLRSRFSGPTPAGEYIAFLMDDGDTIHASGVGSTPAAAEQDARSALAPQPEGAAK